MYINYWYNDFNYGKKINDFLCRKCITRKEKTIKGNLDIGRALIFDFERHNEDFFIN